MFEHIKIIESRLTADDKRQLSDIYAPTVVATQDEDAWWGLCVVPDGRIRFYGIYNKKHIFDTESDRCYIESCDGGLSWKRHVVYDREAVGASARIPDDYGKNGGQYIRWAYDETNKFHAVFCDSPDGHPTHIAKISDGNYKFDYSRPLFMTSKKRMILIVHDLKPEIHPTAFFAMLFISDDCGESWHKVDPGMAPQFEKAWPHKGYRWQQNYRENTIEELSDGRLMMLARTGTDYHYVNYSSDGGDTWTTPEPSCFHSTGTMPRLKKLSDGRLLLTWCNTKLLPELPTADGVWEDYFTNRDINHAAISEDDGKTWIGFREMALSPVRNSPDARSAGGPSGGDKSVHQFEILELPMNKVLVAYGQHTACRRIIIFDLNWLYEKERSENFLFGLANLSTHTFVKSVSGGFKVTPQHPYTHSGHCAYNRTSTALLLPSPEGDNKEVLHICRTDDERLVSNIGGAVWNFPISHKGEVKIRTHIDGKGLRLSLLDHWMNPCDDTVSYFADFSFVARSDMMNGDGYFTEFVLTFDCEKGEVTVTSGDYLKHTQKMNGDHPNGLCYLHMQSAATEKDMDGALVAGMEYRAIE